MTISSLIATYAPPLVGSILHVFINRKFLFEKYSYIIMLVVLIIYFFYIILLIYNINILIQFFSGVLVEEIFRMFLHEKLNKNFNIRIAIYIGCTFGFFEIFTKTFYMLPHQNIELNYIIVLGFITRASSVPLHGLISLIYNNVRLNSNPIFSLISCFLIHLSYNFFVTIFEKFLTINNLYKLFLFITIFIFLYISYYLSIKVKNKKQTELSTI